MQYKELCQQVIELVKETGQYVKSEGKKAKNIEVKGQNDFVTHVDKGSEKRLVEGLSKLLPESGFIAEEGTSTKKGEVYNWIIDPIDGTTNFIHGLSPHAISVALEENDEIVIGVVFELGLEECFYAWKGSKAYLNGHEIEVSSAKTINESLIATGFPYSNFSMLEGFTKTMDFFMKNSHGLRRLGSAATDLVYVACGRFDAFYEYDLKPYDVAAGAFIVQQAGGKNSDFSGGENYIYGKQIVSSNNDVFEDFQSVIQQLMLK